MRILAVVDTNYIHTLKWANGLAHRGHRLHLIPWGEDSSGALPYRDNVTVESTALSPISFRHPGAALRSAARLRAIWASFQPDLVHAHFLGHGAWLAAAAGLRPLVISVMGGGDLVGTRWTPTSRVERLFTPFALRRSDLVVCWSRNLERIVRSISGPTTPTEVIVGGIDRSVFHPGPASAALRDRLHIPADAFVVFSPRLFWPRQNIETIVRGFALLRRDRQDAVLILVRYLADRFPEYAKRMDEVVKELGLSEHVRQVPAIPNEEMAHYFRIASVTVSIPSTDGTPMTAMESLACGTPVVLSDLPDYDSEFFSEIGDLSRVDPGDPEALARALFKLASSDDLRSRILRVGPSVVERHADQERELSRMEACYRTVLERRRP